MGGWPRSANQRAAVSESLSGSCCQIPPPPPVGVEIFAPTGSGCQPVICGHEPVRYTIDFGDGTPPIAAFPGVWINHSYRRCGMYLVTITGTYSDGSRRSIFSVAFAW
jgi:hypothetical protein